jgi:2-polyprenyl-3-methyl-5-hydroxy-6-metoxy-1,4-benzoquinol methylase
MQWYKKLFSNYANQYEQEVFVQGTLNEVTFIEQEIQSDTSKTILDIGCGTGRHAIELTKRGYQVVGIDLSKEMLAKAKEKAQAANVEVQFLERDARDFQFDQKFDLAIMICEGAFPLMETDEMNYAILKNAAAVLTEGGKFIFTTLNGLFATKNFLGKLEKNQCFDPMTFRMHSEMSMKGDDGTMMNLHTNERYYLPSELHWMLSQLGFRQIDMFGAKLGAFSRNDQLGFEDFEILVIAEK